MGNDQQSIKVLNAALDETPAGEIILRGVIDCASLRHLGVDHYQREALYNAKVKALQAAISDGGGVPDIVLGMRGERFITREGVYYLQDDVYVVDGLQRMTAAIRVMQASPGARPHLGATIHFNTNAVTEQEMFEKLNLGQTTLSPNVTLRNFRDRNGAIGSLYKLTEDKNFVLHDKVSWDQNMKRGQLITANTFVKVAAMLHSHAGPGRSNNVSDLAGGLEKIVENVGKNNFIQNSRLFFEVIDSCFGIRRVAYRNGASFLKSQFLFQLARVLSDHAVFWDGDKLVLDAATIKKLASFPVNDPEVMRLSASSGTAGEMLYMLIVNHLNYGKRTKRLEPRRGIKPLVDAGYGSIEGE